MSSLTSLSSRRGLRSPGVRRHLRLGAALATALVVVPVLTGTVRPAPSAAAATAQSASATTCGAQPKHEPSGMAPIAPKVFKGWTRIYCNDFFGTRLPYGWERFRGVPKGDRSGLWSPSHVSVHDGQLVLNTSRDRHLRNRWVSGGACLCRLARTYGAYFVRSRLTGGGASDVELLWPKNNVWPPEVDFFESWQLPYYNTFTDHYSQADHQVQGWLTANLMKWHTWGVVWTPREIKFEVEYSRGVWQTWGVLRDRAQIPREAMTLDLQQQVWCSIGPACPTKPSSMLVDWVTEFAVTSSIHHR